jgi:energy-coupling factor transporter ATP-binding protein EcfA2
MLIPVDAPITIVLAVDHSAAIRTTPSRPLVIVAADRGKWNDFSKNFHADVYVLKDEGEPHRLQAFLVFADAERSRGRIEELLGERPTLALNDIPDIFCTIMMDDGSYRDIVTQLGLASATAALRGMHDVVLANAEKRDEPFLLLTRTQDFHEAALRQERTWVALRRGGRHLRMEPLPILEDAAQTFTMTANLPGLPTAYELTIAFENNPLLRGRMAVLLGSNGSGKTRLLRSLVDGLLAAAPWPELRGDGPAATFDPPPRFSKLVVLSSVATDQFPRAIPPWAGLDYRYHSMTGRRDEPDDDLTLALLDCLREDLTDGAFADGGRMDLLREMIEPLGVRAHLHVELRPVDPPDNLGGSVVGHGGKLYAKIFGRMPERNRLRMISRVVTQASPMVITNGEHRPLSSGELALLRFAAQSTAAVERATLFLFDEPETHLHPNFVSRFMAMLGRLLDLTGSAAIIATHSAYVVREVPSRSVKVLVVDDGGALALEPRMQTFGASIDAISQFVFGDTEPDHLYLRTLREWVDQQPAGLTVERLVEEYSGLLNPETLSYLARLIRSRNEI